MEERANLQGLFMIPEYDFEHCISSLTSGDWQNENGIQCQFAKCADFLRFKSRPDVGMTVMISPKWIFVCPLTQPYANSSLGHPVYLDGLSLAGLVTLQVTDAVWPATAGLEDLQPTIFGAMEKSAYIQQIIPLTESENPLTNSVERSQYKTQPAESQKSGRKSAAASATKSNEK